MLHNFFQGGFVSMHLHVLGRGVPFQVRSHIPVVSSTNHWLRSVSSLSAAMARNRSSLVPQSIRGRRDVLFSSTNRWHSSSMLNSSLVSEYPIPCASASLPRISVSSHTDFFHVAHTQILYPSSSSFFRSSGVFFRIKQGCFHSML